MTVKDTSLEAYWAMRTGWKFGKQEAVIADNLNVFGPATRAELAERTTLQLSAVCGRVNHLITIGCIEEFDKVVDARTKKRVWKLRIKEG